MDLVDLEVYMDLLVDRETMLDQDQLMLEEVVVPVVLEKQCHHPHHIQEVLRVDQEHRQVLDFQEIIQHFLRYLPIGKLL
jgi:hypothetical protein